jgi:hypothetical protein
VWLAVYLGALLVLCNFFFNDQTRGFGSAWVDPWRAAMASQGELGAMCSSSLSCPIGNLVSGRFSAQGELFQWRRCGALRAGARGQGSLSSHGRECSGDGLLLLVQARAATLLTTLLLRVLPSTPPGASLSVEGHRGLQLLFLYFSFVLLGFINLKLGTLCRLLKKTMTSSLILEVCVFLNVK